MPTALQNTAQLLSIIKSGSLSVGVSGLPLVNVDADSKSVEIEAKGLKQCGIKLSKLIRQDGGGVTGMLKSSEGTAKVLSEIGWNLSLYEGGDKILTMGNGVSRLTGHIRFSPLKLRKILDALF